MSKTETVRALSDSPKAQQQAQEIRTVAELQRQLAEIGQQISQIRQTTEQQTADSLGTLSQISQRRLSEALDEMTRQAATAYDKPIQELAGQIKAVTESTATISDQAKTDIPKLLVSIRKERERLTAIAETANGQTQQASRSAAKASKQARAAAVHAHNTGKLMVVGMVLSGLLASLVTCAIWLTVT